MLRSVNIAKTELIVRGSICHKGGGTKLKRLLIIGLTGCAFSLAPTISPSAMPAATPYTLGGTDEAVIQVRRPWAWVGPSRRSRPPLWLVPRPPLWLAASSPLVVTFTSDQKGAAVGSWRPDFVQCRQSGAFAPRSLSLINRTKTQARCAGDFPRGQRNWNKLSVVGLT